MFQLDDIIMVFGNDGILPFDCTGQVISPLRDAEVSLVVYFWNSQIDIVNTSCAIVHMWVSQNRVDDRSTLVQVVVWRRQEASHYLNLC